MNHWLSLLKVGIGGQPWPLRSESAFFEGVKGGYRRVWFGTDVGLMSGLDGRRLGVVVALELDCNVNSSLFI